MSCVSTERRLIVNADDFGYSRGINRGIIRTHEQGIVTSTSLMVRWPYAAEAAAYAGENPRLGVGLHVDFGEWYYSRGWRLPRYVVVPEGSPAVAFEDELRRQLDSFRVLTGKEPSHIDSHQHLHFQEPLGGVFRRLCNALRLPLRATPPVRFCGAFYGQGLKGRSFPERVSVSAFCTILAGLPSGTVEIGCHPSLEVDFESVYAHERIIECATLCDPVVAQCINEHGFQLSSFHGVDVMLGVIERSFPLQ